MPSTTPVLDDFNRADGGLGSNWTDDPFNYGATAFTILSNEARCVSSVSQSDMAWWNPETFAADQEAYVTVSALPSNDIGVVLRIQSPNTSSSTGDGFRCVWVAPDSRFYIERYDNAVATSISSQTGLTTLAAGDIVLARVVGTTFQLWLYDASASAWEPYGTPVTDVNYNSAGYIGMYSYESNSARNGRCDNFGGGAVRSLTLPTITGSGSFHAVATGTTRVVTLPSHQAGDILVVAAAYNSGSNLTIDGSWNVLEAAQNSANMSTAWWWKRAASASETNPTVTSSVSASASNGLYATAWRIRGCTGNDNPFEGNAATGSPTTSTTPAGAAVTTQWLTRLLVVFCTGDDDVAFTSGYPTRGYTSVSDAGSTTGGDARMSCISIPVYGAGPVKAPTVGTWGARYWRTVTAAFIPPASVPYQSPPSRRFQHMLIR